MKNQNDTGSKKFKPKIKDKIEAQHILINTNYYYFRVRVSFPWRPQMHPVMKTQVKLKEPPQKLEAKLQPLLGVV